MFFFSIFDDHSQLSSPLGCWIPAPDRARARDSILQTSRVRGFRRSGGARARGGGRGRGGRAEQHHGSAPGGSPISCPPCFCYLHPLANLGSELCPAFPFFLGFDLAWKLCRGSGAGYWITASEFWLGFGSI